MKKNNIKQAKYACWLGKYRRNCREHFFKRANERLNWQVTREEYDTLENLFITNQHNSHHKIKSSYNKAKKTWYLINFNDRDFWALYNFTYKTLVTVLPETEIPDPKIIYFYEEETFN